MNIKIRVIFFACTGRVRNRCRVRESLYPR
jgi:hypothetical protein